MAALSAWRANDVVEHDLMRDASARLTGVILGASRHDPQRADALRAELAGLRREMAAVDSFDRTAVVTLRKRIERRLAEFEVAAHA